tara:strand:- start:1197 stop:1520 length:324 start_codon:yes stop_codon:yes gene_type:complete
MSQSIDINNSIWSGLDFVAFDAGWSFASRGWSSGAWVVVGGGCDFFFIPSEDLTSEIVRVLTRLCVPDDQIELVGQWFLDGVEHFRVSSGLDSLPFVRGTVSDSIKR